jgi:hypothetical protein
LVMMEIAVALARPKRREPIMRKGHTKGTLKAKRKTTLSRDKLIKPTKKGAIELTEKELGRVSGGLAIFSKWKHD